MRGLNPRPMSYLFLFYNLRTIQQLTMIIIIMYVVYLHDCKSTEEKIKFNTFYYMAKLTLTKGSELLAHKSLISQFRKRAS